MATPSLHPLLSYLRRLSGGMAGDVEDAQLLRRFLAQRDESAFTAIVQRYGAMVWALCVRRLGETPEAEDAFQATFLVLVRKAQALRDPEPLGPWLYGVAYRTALKLRGRRARLAARETALPEQTAEERPEQIWSDLRPILDEEVNRLPTKYRQPVLLCYLQGLSSEEAARRLGCAKGTIFSRLSRARDLLRRRLSKRGVGVPAGALAAVLTDNAVRSAPPAILCASTIRTSLLFAAGTTSPALSAPLAALVEGVLRSMFLSKVKFVAIVLLTLGLFGSGAGFVAHRTSAEQPGSKPVPAPILPAAVADKAKEKEPEAKPKPKANEAFAVAQLDTPSRLKEWRDKLNQPVEFGGFQDPKMPLDEALKNLGDRYNLVFRLNEKAFKFENIMDVERVEVASPNPIPAMKASLRTILQAILDRVPVPSGATFLLRKDHVEITTNTFIEIELGRATDPEARQFRVRPELSLVWDAFEDVPIAQALQRIADTNDLNVVTDPRVAKNLQLKVTAQFNNVAVDTVMRLLMNMADVSMVQIDNVFYLTTAENAKQLREEQAKINFERLGAGPAPDKPAK
ncbi:MAG TPA: sigma-70 family RNA polymerase sigma factor [Gemmataceae bacterium]|jgi:RNA polymerase sigma factor (sigma-70 family)